MKYLTLLTVLSTALATPLQHQHHHHHEHARRAEVTKVVYVNGNGDEVQSQVTENASSGAFLVKLPKPFKLVLQVMSAVVVTATQLLQLPAQLLQVLLQSSVILKVI